MLDLYGWDWWHVPSPGRFEPGTRKWVPARSAAGLCDIIAMHDDPPRLLFLEVKAEKGKLSGEQVKFLKLAKLIAGMMMTGDEPPIMGVHAVWPKDEEAVHQMLRSKNLS